MSGREGEEINPNSNAVWLSQESLDFLERMSKSLDEKVPVPAIKIEDQELLIEVAKSFETKAALLVETSLKNPHPFVAKIRKDLPPVIAVVSLVWGVGCLSYITAGITGDIPNLMNTGAHGLVYTGLGLILAGCIKSSDFQSAK